MASNSYIMSFKSFIKKYLPKILFVVLPIVFLFGVNIPSSFINASKEVRYDDNGNIFYIYDVEEENIEYKEDYSNTVQYEPSCFETKINSRIHDLDINDWKFILVNKNNPLEEDIECELTEYQGFDVDTRIYEPLTEMFKAAKEDGIDLCMASGYRDYNTQKYLFDKKIYYFRKLGYSKEEALDIASMKVTPPLTSEHETGLAIDILSYSYNRMDQGFGESEAGIWLKEHSYEYGFILRYGKNKEDITMIQYEPWHFRYVGKDAAEFIYINDLTFEEFYDMLMQENIH